MGTSSKLGSSSSSSKSSNQHHGGYSGEFEPSAPLNPADMDKAQDAAVSSTPAKDANTGQHN